VESLFEEEAGGPAEGQTRVPARDQPLAARMRPATLDELAGQGHLLEPGSALRTALEEGNPHSMVLFGPPGTGKTTIARLMAVAGGAQPDPGGAQPDRRSGEHRTDFITLAAAQRSGWGAGGSGPRRSHRPRPRG